MSVELAKTRAAEYEVLLETLGLEPDKLEITDGTIVSRAEWQPAAGASAPGIMAELAMGETIGEGGMGVVRRAEQLTLRREVAVKQLRADTHRTYAQEQLLREAWVTGGLEHPNIVPVYALGTDPDGNPVIVMKKIEGTAWKDLIDLGDAPSGHADLDAATDRLAWHLNVFQTVCNALAFAHSRGIIHRDIKPDNVMVGAFGEVYLLDWGIAVSLDDETLPLARDVKTVAGTPAFMAPEMASADGESIDQRTDV